MARSNKDFVLKYASRIREIPDLLMWVMLPGGIVVGRPGFIRKHYHEQLQALDQEYLADAKNEKSGHLAFEAAKCYMGSTVYNAGMTLIDPAQVSAWGIYDPEKNTFEKG